MLNKFNRFARFDASNLYAYKGGSKPKKQVVHDTPTQYDGVTSSSFGGPFGSGSSTLNKATGSIDSTATLSPELQTAANTAQTGLGNNLAYINRNPQEQVNFATSGQDPLYNTLHEQANQNFDNNLGRLRLTAFQGGGLNSTAAGASYGHLAYNKDLLDQQNLLSALQYGNQQATQNTQTNLGAIGGLAQLVYPLESAANAQVNTALQSKDRADATTAAAQNQAESAYTQALNQYSANKSAGMGSGIGSIIGTIGGAALGSVIPGAGTMLGAQLGGALGGAAGGAIQGKPTQYTPYIPNFGATGGSVAPSYNAGGYDLSSGLPTLNSYYSSPQFLNLGMAVA